MSAPIANSGVLSSRSFDLIKDSMLQSDELPLAGVLDCDQWQAVFDDHGIDFGGDEDAIYTPAITLWALISQAFFKAEMRSCKAAVGRVADDPACRLGYQGLAGSVGHRRRSSWSVCGCGCKFHSCSIFSKRS